MRLSLPKWVRRILGALGAAPPAQLPPPIGINPGASAPPAPGDPWRPATPYPPSDAPPGAAHILDDGKI